MALQTVTLTDASIGSTATILTDFGFNCFRFQAIDRGEPIEVIWAEPQFAQGEASPSGSGVPLLFPFPGRIPGVEFVWEGKTYSLQAGDGRGNAIHGFVHERPWRVVEESDQRVVGVFHASQDDPSLLDRWPADFRITAAYELNGNTLTLDLSIENPSDRPLPCGLGVHPYFRVPLGGEADRCLVQLPVAEQWELKNMLPTGEKHSITNAEQFHQGLTFGEMAFDDVFTGLTFEAGRCLTRVIDPLSERALSVCFNDAFREIVLYNPAHREAVCIEPYTCVPGPFHLAEQGVDAGLRILAPGESFHAKAEITLGAP